MRARCRAGAALVALVLAACTSSTGRGAPRPDAPPIVVIGMEEYEFLRPPVIPAGRVVFRFENDGEILHQPDIVALGEDVPEIHEQIQGDNRATVTQLAGIPPRDPGQTGTFALDLVEGQRYAVLCFARDLDDDESHALQGMVFEFRAGGAPAGPTTTG